MQFNWLHLTDLHRGMRQQQWMWPNVAEQLAEDLAHLRPQSGPWDLILFTGDLTDRGSAAQFSEVDEVLAEIKSLIAKGQGGREPILLAVPGNHDLQRPSADDAGLRALQGWAQDPAIQETLWAAPDSVVRQTIAAAFSDYGAWWARQVAIGKRQPNGILDYREGLLPGDFSATLVNAGGCRLGLLGLNTAFLQLTAGDLRRPATGGTPARLRGRPDPARWAGCGHHRPVAAQRRTRGRRTASGPRSPPRLAAGPGGQ